MVLLVLLGGSSTSRYQLVSTSCAKKDPKKRASAVSGCNSCAAAGVCVFIRPTGTCPSLSKRAESKKKKKEKDAGDAHLVLPAPPPLRLLYHFLAQLFKLWRCLNPNWCCRVFARIFFMQMPCFKMVKGCLVPGFNYFKGFCHRFKVEWRFVSSPAWFFRRFQLWSLSEGWTGFVSQPRWFSMVFFWLGFNRVYISAERFHRGFNGPFVG